MNPMNISAPGPLDAFILDLDGTLWDASAACAMAWNKTFAEAGYTDTVENRTIRIISGTPMEVVLREHYTFIKEKDYGRIVESYKVNEAFFMRKPGGRLFSHVLQTLKTLSLKTRLYIVSNCMEGYIENFLALKKLEKFFHGYICSGDTGLSKGENIGLLIGKYKPGSPVYVGDTSWDYEASKKNRIPFIHAAYGFGKVDGAEYAVRDFRELLTLI